MQPVTELKLKPVGQAWIDGPELGEGAAALLRVEIAQVGLQPLLRDQLARRVVADTPRCKTLAADAQSHGCSRAWPTGCTKPASPPHHPCRQGP